MRSRWKRTVLDFLLLRIAVATMTSSVPRHSRRTAPIHGVGFSDADRVGAIRKFVFALHMSQLRGVSILSLVVLSSCAAVRGTDAPATNANVGVATQYWFRGVPQSEEMVAQGEATITVPLENADTLAVTAWGNYQLSSSTGNAAFADRNGGDFTELDMSGTYTGRVDEATVFGGVISYNFPNAVGFSTTELMLGATFEDQYRSLSHTLMLYYDIDQADDYYLTYGIGHTAILDDRFTASFNGLVGFMGDGQAELYFGRAHSGLSDVSASGLLRYQYDEFTTVFARATAIAVPDARLREAEQDRDFKTSTVVFTFGVGWSL